MSTTRPLASKGCFQPEDNSCGLASKVVFARQRDLFIASPTNTSSIGSFCLALAVDVGLCHNRKSFAATTLLSLQKSAVQRVRQSFSTTKISLFFLSRQQSVFAASALLFSSCIDWIERRNQLCDAKTTFRFCSGGKKKTCSEVAAAEAT